MAGIMEFITMETHDIPTPLNITFDAPTQDFVAQEWHYVHLIGKKLDYVHLKHVHLKHFLNYDANRTWEQPLSPLQYKIINAYNTSKHTRHWSWHVANYPNLQKQQIVPLWLLRCSLK